MVRIRKRVWIFAAIGLIGAAGIWSFQNTVLKGGFGSGKITYHCADVGNPDTARCTLAEAPNCYGHYKLQGSTIKEGVIIPENLPFAFCDGFPIDKLYGFDEKGNYIKEVPVAPQPQP